MMQCDIVCIRVRSLKKIEWPQGRAKAALLIETSRRTLYYATPSRDIYKKRNQNTTHVAVNTILGKSGKSFLAY